jgi:hypothetical protein
MAPRRRGRRSSLRGSIYHLNSRNFTPQYRPIMKKPKSSEKAVAGPNVLKTSSLAKLKTSWKPSSSRKVVAKSGKVPWSVKVDGKDLVVENVLATCFGGKFDSGDDGTTASGVKNDGYPKAGAKPMGVALPVELSSPKTNNSPIAFKEQIPWKSGVKVWRITDGEAKAVNCILIDNGPNTVRYPSHALDLNPNVALLFAPDYDPKEIANGWSENGFSYRIIGGAQYASGSITAPISSASLIQRAVTAETGGHGSSNVNSKPPIKQFIQSPNHSSRNGARITMIVLHCTEAPLAITISTFKQAGGGNPVSAHYVINNNGDIYQMVADSERAWHCMGANSNSIGIEHVAGKQDAMTAEQTKSSVDLIRWLLAEYDIPRHSIYGHNFAPGYDRPGGTSCPDKLFGPAHTQQEVTDWVARNV